MKKITEKIEKENVNLNEIRSIKLNKKTMNKTNIVLSIFAMVLVLTLLPSISAAQAVTVVAPVNWGNYSTSMAISVTTSDALNATGSNVTIYCNTSNGPMDSMVGADIIKIATITPTDATYKLFNTSASITTFTDKLGTYNCSAYADNNTAQWFATASASNITIDNTAPVCTISVPVSNVPNQGFQTVTWSVTDALSLVSNNQNITGPTGFTTLTSTSAASSTEFGLTNLIGNWKSDVSGKDRAGNSCLGTVSFTSYNNDYGSNYVPTTTTGTNVKAVLIIAGIGVAFYFLFFKKN